MSCACLSYLCIVCINISILGASYLDSPILVDIRSTDNDDVIFGQPYGIFDSAGHYLACLCPPTTGMVQTDFSI